MPAPTEEPRTDAESAGEDLANRYVYCIVVTGIAVIFLCLLVEEMLHLKQEAWVLTLRLVEHLGVSAVLIGVVGLLLERRDWQEYFHKRLARVVMDRAYLDQLSREELIALQTATLKAYYRTTDIDREGSFLQYFHQKIQDYLVKPYRQNVQTDISVVDVTDGRLRIQEVISYRCRLVSGRIQDDVIWSVDHATGRVEQFKVKLQVPPEHPSLLAGAGAAAAARAGGGAHGPAPEATFEIGRPGGGALQPFGPYAGWRLSLRDYQAIDNLLVIVSAVYTIDANAQHTWAMSHPSKGITASLRYGPDLEIQVDHFGFERTEVLEERSPGRYALRYDSWLLPRWGLAFHLALRNPAAQTPGPVPAPAAATATGNGIGPPA